MASASNGKRPSRKTRAAAVEEKVRSRVAVHSPLTAAERREARRRLTSRGPRRYGSFAMIQPQLAELNSVAAQKVGEQKIEPGSRYDRLWQPQAYDFSRIVGELGYVLNLTANAVASSNLNLREMPASAASTDTPDGDTPEAVLSEDPRARRVMAAFVGERGGQRELKYRFAFHASVAGETWLLGSEQEDDGIDLGITWEFLSTEEIRVDQNGRTTRHRDGHGREPLPAGSYLARSWVQDPRFSDRAVSPVARIMPILTELVTLTQMVDAQIKSKIPAGIFFVPQEMSFEGEDTEDTDTDDGYGEDTIDPFTRKLMEHLSAPIENRQSAASLVPLVMRGPGDLGDKIKLISLSRDLDKWAMDLRDEAIQRLAAGLDIPPEILRGKGSLNHWSAWNLDQDFVVKHVAPIGDLMADFVTSAYLRPMLEEFEGLDPADAARFSLEFDPSPIMVQADASNIARQLFDRRAISFDALRRHSGYDDADSPDLDEATWRTALDLVHKQPNLAPFLLRLVPGFEDVKVDIGLGVRSAKQILEAPEEPVNPTETGPDTEDGGGTGNPGPPPAPVSEQQPSAGPPGAASITERLATGADAALERALERCGQKIINRAGRDIPLRDRLAAIDKCDAHTVVTARELHSMRLSYHDLFGDAWDRYTARARVWVRDWLESLGIERLDASDQAAHAISDLQRELDTYLGAALHRPLVTFANGLRIPPRIVEAVVESIAPVGVL